MPSDLCEETDMIALFVWAQSMFALPDAADTVQTGLYSDCNLFARCVRE